MSVPIVIGLYVCHRKLTTFSEPAVLTLWPGRIRLETGDGVLLDAPAQAVGARWLKTACLPVLHLPPGLKYKGSDRIYLCPLGTPSAPPFPPQIEAGLRKAQALSAQDPETGALPLGAHGWVGSPRGETKYVMIFGSVLPRNMSQKMRELRMLREVGPELWRTLQLCGLPEAPK